MARLAGQLASSLQLDGVTYQLSTPRRRAEENRLIKEAVDAFRARAAATAEAFGYKSYEIKQIKLGTSHHSEGNNDGVVAFAAAPRMARDEGSMPSLADQGGDTTITPHRQRHHRTALSRTGTSGRPDAPRASERPAGQTPPQHEAISGRAEAETAMLPAAGRPRYLRRSPAASPRS